MKLLYITNQVCGSGGLERVLAIKANYLIQHYDYEIHMITLNQGKEKLFYDFSDQIVFHDLNVSGNPVAYFKQYKRQINEVVDLVSPDVISVCDDGVKGFFVPKILKKKIPILYERHASKNIFKNVDHPGLLTRCKYAVMSSLMDIGARSYDAFIVLTNYNLTEWTNKNIHVIPNPLSFEVNKELNPNAQNKLIFVGSHVFQKGIDRLLKIWKTIHTDFPDWSLEIYGKMDEAKTYSSMAASMELGESVRFFNPVRDIKQKYEEASIYVMTSRSEGFGMVLIEAMSVGVPCVAFDCPCGPTDIITHGEDGFLIENGAIETFAETLSGLMKNKTQRLQMGEKALQHVKRYEVAHVMPIWDRLFNTLIKK